MTTKDIIGLPVAVTSYSEAVDQILSWSCEGSVYLIEAANTHVAALARHDPSFRQVMAQFDLICPDGMPLVWSLNQQLPLESQLKDRVYGPTLMLKALEASRGDTHRHFFLGGKEETLDKLEVRFTEEFPELSIVGAYSPPFDEWPTDELDKICEQIKSSNANIVWVGLGCPKQERWVAQNKDRLPPATYLTVGAAFAFHAGEVSQAPKFLQKMGCEWLYRLVMEPRRLFKRYVVYNSLFIFYSLVDARKG